MIEKDPNQFLWVESYRPKTVEECVLPERLKLPFKEYVKAKEIPNLMLTGSAGVGKTTVAKALCEEIGCDYIILNGSSKFGVDMVHNTVSEYASSISLNGQRKVIIVDEADGMTAQAQQAFRASIEKFSLNCTFIFTCNYKEKIIEPIHSRCAVVDFRLTKDEKSKMAVLFFKRVQEILKLENVDANEKVVAEVVKKFFPDFRRTLNELQRYSKLGKIDIGVLSNLSDESISEVIGYLKEKNFGGFKKWIFNSDYDSDSLYRKLFDAMYEQVEPKYVPLLVTIIADYMYKKAFVADTQLNDLAMLSQILVDVEFKS
jgi:DNA polymerase III delta prime subunit